jgi:hypothetical protein
VLWFARLLGRWPVALACVVALAAAVLLPGLGRSGLWEPHERQLADRAAQLDAAPAAPRLPAKLLANRTPPPAAPQACPHEAPRDAVSRSLEHRAPAWGQHALADSDVGRRLPGALLGLILVLAAAGIAMRTAGPRAGVITALVLLSMPLLALQARQLTTEIGTAAGGALVVYGLVALGRTRGVRGVIDAVLSLAALAGGVVLGFCAGGALLGVLVPIGAYAAANALGTGAIGALARSARAAALRIARAIRPRWGIGRTAGPIGRPELVDQVKALVATLAVIAVIAWLAYQVFDLRAPQPGLVPPERALFGKAIVPSGCWSSALGGTWRPQDDMRYIFDSSFEQIAYGTFPWGLLAPIAMFALLGSKGSASPDRAASRSDAKARSPDRARARLGALTLAWASAAWIATEVFQRKVGFTLWAGFPALAIAIGAWLDGALAGPIAGRGRALPAGAKLLGVFVLCGVIDLGKDLQEFPQRLTSLLVGDNSVPYPATSHLLFLPTKLWVFVLGAAVALGFAVALIAPSDHDIRGRIARVGAAVALAATAAFAAFWPFGWQPKLAESLSSKALFDTYEALRAPGDALVILGDLGGAPHDYAPDVTPEIVPGRPQLVAALDRPTRVFAIAPQTERCQLHRDMGGHPYFLLDDRNLHDLLLSNRVDGTTDKNPLRTAILHAPPANIPSRPASRIVFDGQVELLGWKLPASVHRGQSFEVTLYYKILRPVGGAWQIFLHFDNNYGRLGNGDHKPIHDLCPTSTWQPGDYIVDTHTVQGLGGAFPSGPFDVVTGFFTGSNPNFRNMSVSGPTGDVHDNGTSVRIGRITLR